MFKLIVFVCVVAASVAAPAPQQNLPQVPGLDAFLAQLAQHQEAERQVAAAAARFPPNPNPVVSDAGAIGASGIVGSSGNIGPSGLCGPSGCIAFRR